MIRRSKRRKRSSDGVELNVTAMLDMAFQLLAFFILTWKPDIIEDTVAMRLPKAEPLKSKENPAPAKVDPNSTPTIQLESLTVSIDSTPEGKIKSILLDNAEPARDLVDLGAKMQRKLTAAGAKGENGIEQVILEIAPRLEVQELMRIFDVCLSRTLSDGKRLTKISPVLAKPGAPKK
jgi:biopolymer transport protein ExbD